MLELSETSFLSSQCDRYISERLDENIAVGPVMDESGGKCQVCGGGWLVSLKTPLRKAKDAAFFSAQAGLIQTQGNS